MRLKRIPVPSCFYTHIKSGAKTQAYIPYRRNLKAGDRVAIDHGTYVLTEVLRVKVHEDGIRFERDENGYSYWIPWRLNFEAVNEGWSCGREMEEWVHGLIFDGTIKGWPWNALRVKWRKD